MVKFGMVDFSESLLWPNLLCAGSQSPFAHATWTWLALFIYSFIHSLRHGGSIYV